MRLWSKSFGKEIKATDFSGRVIVKGAYNDRKSEFGWNVDHIQPHSRGGVTADHNLVCCHILTNDEKADKFPCFKANGIAFEIVKVQNHYEIRRRGNTPRGKKPVADEKTVNLFDSADGIRYFKKLRGMQNKKRFVGTVLVRLENVSDLAVIDFIEKLFERENIAFSVNRNSWNLKEEHCVRLTDYDMPLKSDWAELLDKCVLLNTYLSAYFLKREYISGYEIYYRGDCYEEKQKMYSAQDAFGNISSQRLCNSLYVNHLVLANTETGDKESYSYNEYIEYNYVYTKLAENLEKGANGR